MKLTEIYKILDGFAPVKLSEELCKIENGYDNSGIICSRDGDINTVVFALDLSEKSVEFAKKVGAELIVTHHPAIFAPIKSIKGALHSALSANIGIISMHLNFDVAERGIDYYMAKLLGAKDEEILLKLSSGGYGRRFKVNKTLGEMADVCKKQFGSDKVFCYGAVDIKIETVASFCGSGLDDQNVSTACDLLISADIKHHLILNALDSGKCVIQVTHYACENSAFKRIYGDLLENSPLKNLKTYYFDDDRLK